MMALWKAGGGILNKEVDFRLWQCGRQGGGWIPLKGFSVLIIPPAWCRDGSPPTQPKGLNFFEGFLSVGHSPPYDTLMVPPPT